MSDKKFSLLEMRELSMSSMKDHDDLVKSLSSRIDKLESELSGLKGDRKVELLARENARDCVHNVEGLMNSFIFAVKDQEDN